MCPLTCYCFFLLGLPPLALALFYPIIFLFLTYNSHFLSTQDRSITMYIWWVLPRNRIYCPVLLYNTKVVLLNFLINIYRHINLCWDCDHTFDKGSHCWQLRASSQKRSYIPDMLRYKAGIYALRSLDTVYEFTMVPNHSRSCTLAASRGFFFIVFHPSFLVFH